LNHGAGGGAEDLLVFLRNTLVPWVQANFRTQKFFVISGHSAAGYFSVFAAAHDPELFQGVVATSPALWWNGDSSALALGLSAAGAAHPPRMFVSRGGFDMPMLKNGIDRFAKAYQQKQRGNNSFKLQVYPEDNHQIGALAARIDGLRFVFQPVSLTTSEVGMVDSFDAAANDYIEAFIKTRARYMANASALKLRTTLPPEWIKWLQSLLRSRERPKALLKVCDQYALDRPDLSIGHACGADASVMLGDTAPAVSKLARAIGAADALRDSAEVARLRKLQRVIRGQ
jgi:hypothetical protein